MSNPAWLPSRYTAPLAPDFPSRGDLLIEFARIAWKTPESPHGLTLDPWQSDLIRRVLEVFPPGHPRAGELRFRQVLISMPRQQGKSVIGSLLALWGLLMHVAGPYVISIASTAEQARIVYDRVLFAISKNPELRKLFSRTTETRGIRTADGSGRYEVKAAKGAALQGLPNSLVIFDEIHISKPEMWQAVVNGQVTRTNGMVIGITTAGDDSSQLLLSLYDQGARAIEDPESRFGFFVWEAPEGCEITREAIIASNPAVACGRLDVETVWSDIQSQPEPDVRRYRLNQFVKGSGTPWIAPHLWGQLDRGTLPGRPTVFVVDATPGWDWASIATSARVTASEPRTYTEYVAALCKPDLARLVNVCLALAQRHRATFVMDGFNLGELAAELRRRGLNVVTYTQRDIVNASSRAYAQIIQGQVIHDGAEIVADQIGRGIRKNVADAWRIVRPATKDDIDALMATVLAIYAAEAIPDRGVLIG